MRRMEIISRIQVCQFDGRTLILRKIMERKAFPAKAKHQNRASKLGERIYTVQPLKE